MISIELNLQNNKATQEEDGCYLVQSAACFNIKPQAYLLFWQNKS